MVDANNTLKQPELKVIILAAHIQVRPMARSGGRKSRHEAIARSRSGSLLMLCLEAKRTPQLSQETPHVLELGIVASKKQVSKLATMRNRVKRRLRNAARVLQSEPGLSPLKPDGQVSLKLLIVSHREMQNASFEELQRQILSAFKKLLDELARTERI